MGGGGVEEGVMRVLLVDDSPVDRKVVQLVLGSTTFAGSFDAPMLQFRDDAFPFASGVLCSSHFEPFLETEMKKPVPCLLVLLLLSAKFIAVDSAKKAMEFLGLKDGKEQAIDMVLTDYCMPEMTGYDLLKAIKAMSPLKPIPVIVMSSENEPQRISRCLKAGAEDYIVKPLQTKDVPRLRSCSNAKPKDPLCDTVSKGMLLADHAVVVDGTSSPGRRAHLTGIAMVLHSSSAGLSHYFPFLFKFILLVYAILCLGELLHRWSNGAFLSLW